jgi:signal transduction histidine kinase
MKKSLGDILLEKGYISPADLNRALAIQMRKVLGDDFEDNWATTFLLSIARTKYNNRDEFYLGKILTELKLLPETKLLEALAIQKAAPTEKPRGRLDALNRIIVRMNSSYNLIDLLHQILVLAAQLVEAESASLIIHDHTRDSLVILMPTGPGAEAVRDLEIPKNKGIVGWVYAHGRPVISNDTVHDRRFYPAIDAASGYTSRQILCVPLTVKDRKLGAIEAINKQGASAEPGAPPAFSHADRFLLSMFSTQAAIAIENTRLTIALSQLEEDLALQRTSVAEAQQTRVAGMIADSFLHEMQRSLVPLQGYAARLAEAADSERLEKYRSYIDREMSRLMAHAQDVARFLKDEFAPAREAVDLATLVRDLAALVWVDCRTSGISFETDVGKDLQVRGDRELLLKALEHLFRNSRDAMPEGGTFSLVAREAGLADQRMVEIIVSDTGRGIEADPVELVFEPFYTSGKRHAAGLGLSIAKRILEVHGGSIRASNREGSAGTTFTLTLPAA